MRDKAATVAENGKVSAHFWVSEFYQHGTKIGAPTQELVEKLELLRRIINLRYGHRRAGAPGGMPVNMTSGYRGRAYNRRKKGAKRSQHCGECCGAGKGLTRAGDAQFRHPFIADALIVTPEEVAQIAKEIGFTGIGVYDTFTHVDTRPLPKNRRAPYTWGKKF